MRRKLTNFWYCTKCGKHTCKITPSYKAAIEEANEHVEKYHNGNYKYRAIGRTIYDKPNI